MEILIGIAIGVGLTLSVQFIFKKRDNSPASISGEFKADPERRHNEPEA